MAESQSVTRKRCFDAAFKLRVVECAEGSSNRAAATKFHVDPKRVREWRKQKTELVHLPSKKKRLDGGGRKAALPDMEEELTEWIETLRSKNMRVTRPSIQAKAVELAQARGCNHSPCFAGLYFFSSFIRF